MKVSFRSASPDRRGVGEVVGHRKGGGGRDEDEDEDEVGLGAKPWHFPGAQHAHG